MVIYQELEPFDSIEDIEDGLTILYEKPIVLNLKKSTEQYDLYAGEGFEVYEVNVPEDIQIKAKRALDRMLEVSGVIVPDVTTFIEIINSSEGRELAVKVERGAPILTFDTEAAKRRVEALSWVRSASVERLLPDTIVLRVQERQALALWQRKGTFSLIDHEGTVIVDHGLERFSDLLVVVGDDAPIHTAELLRMLGSETKLMDRVAAGVRVGARRWNLRLDNGIDVLLPEEDAERAWLRLSAYEAKHKVLARDIKVLDLRLPDRVVVRRRSPAPKAVRTSGRET